MAKQIFDRKMQWVYTEMPERIIPEFLTEDGNLRAVFTVEELGVYAVAIKKELKKNGYKVNLDEKKLTYSSELLVDFHA